MSLPNSKSAFYWLFLIFLTASLEAVALYYQYELGFEPCVICIKMRVVLAGIFIASIIGLLLKSISILRLATEISIALMGGVLAMLSWEMIKIEKGETMSSCSFNPSLGDWLPSWLPVETWVPYLFEIKASCGVTPELAFGVTMAEGMMAVSSFIIGFILISRPKSN